MKENISSLSQSNLHKNEQLIYLQRKKVVAKQEYLASRTIIKYLIAQYCQVNYHSIELYFNQALLQLQALCDNKPMPFSLSLSHSHGMIFIAIVNNASTAKMLKIGVDIEAINSNRDTQLLANNFYPKSEGEQVQQNGIFDFYRLWTLKEAYSKMLPQAMATTLSQNMQVNLANLNVLSCQYRMFDFSIVAEQKINSATVTVVNSANLISELFPICQVELGKQ